MLSSPQLRATLPALAVVQVRIAAMRWVWMYRAQVGLCRYSSPHRHTQPGSNAGRGRGGWGVMPEVRRCRLMLGQIESRGGGEERGRMRGRRNKEGAEGVEGCLHHSP